MKRMRVEVLRRRPRSPIVAALVAGLLFGLLLGAVSATSAPATEQVIAAGGPVVPIIFPIEKRFPFTDTFGAPRSGGRTHEGNDIMCPKMTPLLAAVDGELDFMNMTLKPSSYNGLPYFNILLRGDDGNDYFYIHLNNDTPGTDDAKGGLANAYAPGLTNGSRVKKGQLIGWAGDSGNAEDAGSHLHFEIHPGGYKNPVNPYNSLKAAPTWAEWQAQNGSTTTTKPATTTTKPSTTTTTKPPATTTTLPPTTTTTVPSLVPFHDVSPADWYYADLVQLYEAGVVKGSADGLFNAYLDVSRAQFAAFLVRAVAPAALGSQAPAAQLFQDVRPEHWAFAEISAAAGLGFVQGVGDGSAFAPEQRISRAQMAVMVYRVVDALLGSAPPSADQEEQRRFKDVPAAYWAAEAIQQTADLGLIGGGADGSFRPDETSKRAHAIAVIARTLRLMEAEGS